MKKDYISYVQKFANQTIGVVGDLMLDHYIFGNAERISQEAPTPIVRATREEFVSGGAANVAANIVSLGGTVDVVGEIGKDGAGVELLKILARKKINTNGVWKNISKPTIQKIRIVATGHQIVRLDKESHTPTSPQIEKHAIEYIAHSLPKWHAVVIADYTKGFITEPLAREILKCARRHKKPVVVDTKPKHFDFFRGVDVITPNLREAEGYFRTTCATERDVRGMGKTLEKRFRSGILITRGADGMTLFEHGRTFHLPSRAKDVFDVTGAGDTVVAALALCRAVGMPLKRSCEIANNAAGIVVGKAGTATLSLMELQRMYGKK